MCCVCREETVFFSPRLLGGGVFRVWEDFGPFAYGSRREGKRGACGVKEESKMAKKKRGKRGDGDVC